MPALQPPRAPSNEVRIESFRVLSRLQLIFEFRVWLEYLRGNVPRRYDSPVILLWDCMSFGAPICTLLDLLGSPTPRELKVFADSFNFDLSMDDRKAFIESFIYRVNMLEIHGRIQSGESLAVDDFLSGGVLGYTKILRTINRLLSSLQDSHPRIFVPPHGWKERRSNLIQQLREAEHAHISRLSEVSEAASKLYAQVDAADSSLEFFVVNCSRLIPYHNILFQPLSKLTLSGEEIWDDIFMFSDKLLRTNIVRAYHSLCANFLPLVHFLTTLKAMEPIIYSEEVDTILRHISSILSRIGEYRESLQAILELSTPKNAKSYDSLCTMTFEMYHLAETINEAGFELRTIWAIHNLKTRLDAMRMFNIDQFGTSILDDRLIVDPVSGLRYSIILFQNILLCCSEEEVIPNSNTRYPIETWELGPAISASCPLHLVFAVPTKSIMTIHLFDSDFFELYWVDGANVEQSITLYPLDDLQYTQWVSNLQIFVSRILYSTSVPEIEMEENTMGTTNIRTGVSYVLTAEEDMRSPAMTPRSWSVVGGRVGPLTGISAAAEMGDTPKTVEDSMYSVNLLSPSLSAVVSNDGIPDTSGVPELDNNLQTESPDSPGREISISTEVIPESPTMPDSNNHLDSPDPLNDMNSPLSPNPLVSPKLSHSPNLLVSPNRPNALHSPIPVHSPNPLHSPYPLNSPYPLHSPYPLRSAPNPLQSPNRLRALGSARSPSRSRRKPQPGKTPLRSAFTREEFLAELSPTDSDLWHAGSPLPQQHLVPASASTPNGAFHSESPLPQQDEVSSTLDLTSQIVREGNYAVAHGGHADIWKATWRKPDNEVGTPVAVKVLRNATTDPQKKAKLLFRLFRELRVWKQLSHPHVLPLYGIANDFGPYPSMVCPWMENGSVSKYLESHHDTLTMSERLRMMKEVAEGLEYLHSRSIIHGDLTGSNVLLDTDLRVHVCDFGLSAVMLDTEVRDRASFTSHLGGAVRWTDSCFFESFAGFGEENSEQKAPVLTCKSDVYSLGCVILEIFSGRPPYHYIAMDAQVVIELHKGNKPRRPAKSFVDDGQWDLIQSCWMQPPEDRPDVRDVRGRLEELIKQRKDREG